ncbi:MAG TPA: hypothetical protein VNZ57_09825, partial [Longimicrobiales bacterium]|nr:hypothetical protein [Longimicrobiales bacterium]
AAAVVERLARGAREQHSSLIVAEPRVHPVGRAGEDGWRYIRVRFRIWPGQQSVIENAVRQRAIAAMRELDPAYADWMVTVTYRIAEPPPSPHQPSE